MSGNPEEECTFCAIVAGEAEDVPPGGVVFSDERAVAFMDLNSRAPGGTSSSYRGGTRRAWRNRTRTAPFRPAL